MLNQCKAAARKFWLLRPPTQPAPPASSTSPCSCMSTSAIIVDDTDRVKIIYFETWTAASTSNEGVYNNTLTLATAPARAQISFIGV